MTDLPRPDFEPDVELPDFVKVPELDSKVAAVERNVDAFDPAIADEVEGLMYLGYLEHRCSVFGHSFVLHSLKNGAELLVGQITAEYQGTHLHGHAYATGLVAASVELVDGHPLLAPLGPDDEASIRQRFDYVNKHWHKPTITAIYREYMQLQERVAKAYEALLEKEGESDYVYVLAELADRQGLLRGDLNALQRTALMYLVGREKKADRDRRVDDFKNMIVAINPEMADVFAEAEEEDLAEPLSDDQMEQVRPLSAEEMNQLDSIVRALGAAVS